MKYIIITQIKILLYLAMGVGSAYIVHQLYLSARGMRFGIAFLGGSVGTLLLQGIMSLVTSLDANSKLKTNKEHGKGR